jgi:hypothetical protein
VPFLRLGIFLDEWQRKQYSVVLLLDTVMPTELCHIIAEYIVQSVQENVETVIYHYFSLRWLV